MPELRHVVNWLIPKYNIDTKNRAPGTIVCPDVITIARLTSRFPRKMCDYYHLGLWKILCNFDGICVDNPGEFSKAVLCNHFIWMVTQGRIKTTQQCSVSSFWCISRKHKKDQVFTRLEDTLSYYSAAYKSAGTLQKPRIKWCGLKGISTATNNGFHPKLLTAIDLARTRVHTMGPTDPFSQKTVTDLLWGISLHS